MFFSKDGISQTEANSIANSNAETARFIDNELKRFSPVSTTLHRNDKSYKRTEADINPERILTLLEHKGKLYRFSAWLRQAVSEKTLKLESLKSSTFYHMVDEPTRPILQQPVGEQWALNQLDIKQMSEYLAAEAEASVYGKMIHEGGLLREWQHQANKPNLIEKGTDLIEITKRNVDQINTLNQELFKKHRDSNKILNSYKAKIQKAVTNKNLDIAKENEETTTKYNNAMKVFEQEKQIAKDKFETEKLIQLKKIAALKIAIPNEFKELTETKVV